MKTTRMLAGAGSFILLIYVLYTHGLMLMPAETADTESGAELEAYAQDKEPNSPEAGEEGSKISPEDMNSPCENSLTEPLRAFMSTQYDEKILETTIQGGICIKNATDYEVSAELIASQKPELRLPAEGPEILIIHTHGSEAYTQAGLDRYEENDDHRTEDKSFSIIRIGDELCEIFEEQGLRVIHDREIYDYPSYTGSYTRSGQAVEKYLRDYPDIAVILDIHRDALGENGVIYKTMAEEEGVCASQIMLLAGSDASGLYHPDWRQNLSLALYLQNAVSSRHPSLMRPVSLVRERYNQQLCPGSLIMEVGCSGNTLQEALAAIRLFGGTAAPALLNLR